MDSSSGCGSDCDCAGLPQTDYCVAHHFYWDVAAVDTTVGGRHVGADAAGILLLACTSVCMKMQGGSR